MPWECLPGLASSTRLIPTPSWQVLLPQEFLFPQRRGRYRSLNRSTWHASASYTWASTLPSGTRFQPQFHRGTHVFTSLLMFPIKTITYIHIPLLMPWFGAKFSTSTSIEEPGQSVPFHFHVQVPGKACKSTTKSQICRFHCRTTMKCTIKALWGGRNFQGAVDLFCHLF